MSNIRIDTKDLKEKLEKTEQTGIVAWQIGSIAHRVKENQTFRKVGNKEYLTFNDYTLGELSKGEDTIITYINIYLKFPNVEDIENLLVSYLRELIRIKDDEIMRITLKVFQELQAQTIGLGQESTEKKYTTQEIQYVVDLIKDSKDLDKKAIEKIVENVKKLRKEQKTERQKKKKNRHGKPLKNLIHCIDLQDVIEYEPIDEQGFVALFCLCFKCLKNVYLPLVIGEQKINVKFKKIRFVRQPFTDVSFIVADNYGNEYTIYAEFEFKTSNYFLHKHHLSSENCDLVISWIDNIVIGGYPDNVLTALPPIFCVREYLMAGIEDLVYYKDIINK